MLRHVARCSFVLLLLVLAARPAAAQLIPGWDSKQFTWEQLDAERIRLLREVEVTGVGPNAGQQIFADELLWNKVTGEFEASGNVLLVSPTARLSAERVVFNTKTGLGTFHTASGIAALGDRGVEDKSMFGTLEPDVYFYGQTIEKIADDKYRITKGGFTTCVQPTPRWDIVSNTAIIDLEDYAMLRNAVVRVKDVPVFYLPIMYYPIQSDDRATGFLLPTYGRSLYRGQSISNAFFWAINRSQDLTIMHDWFTKTGQGVGSEYRYMAAPGSEGDFRAYWLNQKQAAFDLEGGGTSVSSANRSYELAGNLAQQLPGGFRARGRVDYFSDLTTQQLYSTNIYEASRRQRTITGSVSGVWGGLSLTGNFNRSELFNTQTSSTINGYAPSITANLSSKRLGRLPVYFAVNGEASKVVYIVRNEDFEQDLGLVRFDASPTIRAALTNWAFLNVNTSATFRHSYFSESIVEDVQQEVPLTRQYMDFKTEIIGPVFSRVFTPQNAFAERLKHVIEPNFSLQKTTSFENQDGVPTTTSTYDFVVGGVTRLNYGLTNRLLVRKGSADAAAPAASAAARELLSVSVAQSYYSEAEAGAYDVTYQSSYYDRTRATKFSPVAVVIRGAPTALSTATMRMEFDKVTEAGVSAVSLRSFNVAGSTSYRSAVTQVGWSTRKYTGSTVMENTLNASTTLSLMNGRTGGSYFLNWDIARSYIIQQRWVGFYSAQCCGITFEYQQFKYPSSLNTIPEDRRFNMSFTLAGIGTFSNFFGAFGGSRY
jgi:lipopolysaccharide assembly outer membrane protein LptD (OstA)